MMKIDQIWKDLENDESFIDGLLLRRYSGAVLPNIFVGIKSSLKLRCLVVKIAATTIVDFDESNNLKDIIIEFRTDEKDSNFKLLIIILINIDFNDVFSTVCEDLIASVADISNESDIINEILNRFEKWILLFDVANREGLSDEAQRGLYGEVYFIRKWLDNNIGNSPKIVKSWQGPSKSVKDFQIDDWAIEVKTTHGNNHQKVHISSERQLDTTTNKFLFLFHLSLNVLQSSGETLNNLIDEVRTVLDSDFRLLTMFNNRLLTAGYFNHHRGLYESIGYSIRQDEFYHVRDSFPRVEEAELRKGVGDIKYSIIISNCKEFQVSEEHLFKTIN